MADKQEKSQDSEERQKKNDDKEDGGESSSGSSSSGSSSSGSSSSGSSSSGSSSSGSSSSGSSSSNRRTSAPRQQRGGGGRRNYQQQRNYRPNRRGYFSSRRKVCPIRIEEIDWKKVDSLRYFIGEHGGIRPRRKTGATAKLQRKAAIAIKRARHMALLPFTGEHLRLMRHQRD